MYWPCLAVRWPSYSLIPPHQQDRGRKYDKKSCGISPVGDHLPGNAMGKKNLYLLPINNSIGWLEIITKPKRPFPHTSSSQAQIHSWLFCCPAFEQCNCSNMDEEWGLWSVHLVLPLALSLLHGKGKAWFFPMDCSPSFLQCGLSTTWSFLLGISPCSAVKFSMGNICSTKVSPWATGEPPSSLTLVSAAFFLSLLSFTSQRWHVVVLPFLKCVFFKA